MPIHDLGYRSWTGRLSSEATRWRVVAETGILLAWRSRWLRRMLFFAWLPALYFGIGFFLYERFQPELQSAPRRSMAVGFLRVLPDSEEAVRAIQEDPQAARHQVWALLLLTFFRHPQGFLMVLIVGLIAPPLISRDVQSRAFLLYFSRPITRAEYILGKAGVVWGYLALITLAPALALYVLGVLLSPSFSVVAGTWDLPLRIMAASAVLMVPTTAMALCFSSLTRESRYATFAWIAVWALGWVAHSILNVIDASQQARMGALGPGEMPADRWTLISLYHTLGRVQSWVFGLEPEFSHVATATGLLTAITVVSVLVLFRRVSAPMRI